MVKGARKEISRPPGWRFTLAVVLALAASPLAFATPPLPQPNQPAPAYSLDDCLQLALDRNPAILKAQRDIERTQGLVITAKSTLYPHLNVNGRIEERNDDLFDQGTDPTVQRFRDFWTIQLQVVQSLYSGGVNRQQIAIAKLQHEASLIQLQATIDGILQQVKVAVYAIVVDRAQLDSQNQTIKLLADEGKRQKDLFEAGRTTRFNVLRTQVSLGNQQALLSQTQTDLISRQIALAQLLNIEWSPKASPTQPPFLVHADLECPPLEKIKVDDFVTLALARRPELRVMDHQVEIAQRQIKVDKAANLPRIDAYVADEQFRDQTLSSFNKSQNAYAFGLLGTWDVFDGFSSKGVVLADTASMQSQQISRDQLKLQIESDVRDAYARLLAADATLKAQTENQGIAEESVRLARISADSGYATLLDVLQATLDLTAARSDLIRSRQLYLDAQADLEHAVSLKFVDWPNTAAAVRADAVAVPAAALAPSPQPQPATLHP